MRIEDLGPMGELPDANSDLDNPDRLRARLDEDGFVLLRSVVDIDASTRLRHEMIEVLASHGLAEPGADMPIWTGAPKQSPDPVQGTMREQARWRDLCEHPSVDGIAELIYGEPTFWGGITTFRYFLPSDDPTLFLHQDANGIHGSPCLTFWIPLLDVDRQLGGLAVVPGSHKRGLLHHEPTLRVHDDDVPDGLSWLTTDYRQGDVLIFGTLLFHTGLTNRSERTIRLSVDARVQAASAPRPEYFLWTDRIGSYATRARQVAIEAGVPRDDVQRVAYALRDRPVDLDDADAVRTALDEILSASA